MHLAAGDASCRIHGPRSALLQIAMLRGDVATAIGLATLIEEDPTLGDNPAWVEFVAAAARAHAEAGDREAVTRLLTRLGSVGVGAVYRGIEVRDAVVAALAIGDLDFARHTVDASTDPRPYVAENWRLARALVLEAEESIEQAAAEFAASAASLAASSTPQHAHALLGYGRCLVALGRRDAALAPLAEARDVALRMGARLRGCRSRAPPRLHRRRNLKSKRPRGSGGRVGREDAASGYLARCRCIAALRDRLTRPWRSISMTTTMTSSPTDTTSSTLGTW